MNKVSDTGFWISNKDNEHRFVPELSKEINEYVDNKNIKTVYDFGCGRGEYLNELQKFDNTLELTGFEGHQTDGVFNKIVKQDLSTPLNLDQVDMVMSIEVGEHIPKEFEQTFIDNISNHAKSHIFLSWAIVGQSGLGHINCQNNDYVIQQFVDRGWKLETDLSNKIRYNMPNSIWLKNTLMVFTKA
jgi:cyclopropane fatty-acyl-phospholipid synthase-like methyltransferase